MANEYIEEEIDIDKIRAQQQGRQKDDAGTSMADDWQVPDDEDLDIQIQDDRTPDDRDKPLAHEMRTPPPEDTDDDLTPPADDAPVDEREKYARTAVARIKQATAHYHAERRTREEAERERHAAMELAKSYMAQLKNMQTMFTQNEDFATKAMRADTATVIELLSDQLVKAQMEQDAEKIVKTQRALNEAQVKLAQLNGYRPVALRAPDPESDLRELAPRLPSQVQAPQVDEATRQWSARNPWFNTQPKMKEFALALDGELLAQGVNPLTDAKTYYHTIDKEMRQRFPDYPWRDTPPPRATSAPPVVTAGAARTTPRKKGTITLTRSEVATAKRLGLTTKDYALAKQRLERGDA